MLSTGIQAPSFALPDQNGRTHTLEAYRGQKVVLYFYPKDNTPVAPNKPARSANSIRSSRKRARWCWA